MNNMYIKKHQVLLHYSYSTIMDEYRVAYNLCTYDKNLKIKKKKIVRPKNTIS